MSLSLVGVILDETLSFEERIKHVYRSFFFHLRNISKICKYLTKISKVLIYAFVTSKQDLSDAKDRFRRQKGFETQQKLLIEDLASAPDSRDQIDLVILDFCKAFDKVPHQRLRRKLEQIGIRDNILGVMITSGSSF